MRKHFQHHEICSVQNSSTLIPKLSGVKIPINLLYCWSFCVLLDMEVLTHNKWTAFLQAAVLSVHEITATDPQSPSSAGKIRKGTVAREIEIAGETGRRGKENDVVFESFSRTKGGVPKSSLWRIISLRKTNRFLCFSKLQVYTVEIEYLFC